MQNAIIAPGNVKGAHLLRPFLAPLHHPILLSAPVPPSYLTTVETKLLG